MPRGCTRREVASILIAEPSGLLRPKLKTTKQAEPEYTLGRVVVEVPTFFLADVFDKMTYLV